MNRRQKKKINNGLYYGITCWFDKDKNVEHCIAYQLLSPVKIEQYQERVEDGYIKNSTRVSFPTKQPYWLHNNHGIHIARKYIQNIKTEE